ncbi:MAG: LysM peptidoglycan-binding domain-containing protein [Steroidobacteraceae bacterium]
MTLRLPHCLIALVLVAGECLLPVTSAGAASVFVRPAELEHDVAFWRRVYTEVSTDGGFIHDNERVDIVYEILGFPEDLPPARRSQRIDEAKDRVVRTLRKLGSRDPGPLTADEQRIRDLWPAKTPKDEFTEAAERVRYQLGQSNRFREGLVRSGAWMPKIAATFEKKGMPRELAALPHVESSFNTYAYSKVGAAGMWQFMRSTGRRYLRIDNVVDERLDPYKSTEAAAQFLEQNYAVLGSWPLALTAYNHGAAGMRRARDTLGTDNIATIVRSYRSRTFGFASRNFYVAFLAALEIDSNPERFFGPMERDPADASQMTVMPEFMSMRSLVGTLGLDMEQMKRMNPALLPPVWSGTRHVPRGYELRVPANVDLRAGLARVPGNQRFGDQVADTRHQVQSGESLSVIASRYGLPLSTLAELNGIDKPYRVRAGQVLVLPDKKAQVSVGAAKVAATYAEPAIAQDKGKSAVDDERYVVRRGDTLSKIASRHGLTEDRLMELNGIRERNFIYEGQVLSVTQVASAAAIPNSAAVVHAVVEIASAPQGPTAATEAAEPTSEGEADAFGPTLVPGVQAAASADPSDYTVAADRAIRVEAAETLGHYADWLGVRATDLRNLNRMKPAAPLVIGRRLKLDFAKVTTRQFEEKRTNYHKQLQETFFTQFRIVGSETHVVRQGESIWVLAQSRFNVPIWLLRQYNPDVDLGDVRPGTPLVIPHLEPVLGGAPT